MILTHLVTPVAIVVNLEVDDYDPFASSVSHYVSMVLP
jgi:hypothetical protein